MCQQHTAPADSRERTDCQRSSFIRSAAASALLFRRAPLASKGGRGRAGQISREVCRCYARAHTFRGGGPAASNRSTMRPVTWWRVCRRLSDNRSVRKQCRACVRENSFLFLLSLSFYRSRNGQPSRDDPLREQWGSPSLPAIAGVYRMGLA